MKLVTIMTNRHLVFLTIALISLCSCAQKPEGLKIQGSPPLQDIRIAYSTGSVLHAQIGTILQNTDILQKNGLNGKVFPVKRGSEQTELFQKGEIDLGFGSDVPTILNLSLVPDLRIMATPGELARVGILVKISSPVKTLEELRRKTIGLPFDSNAYKELINWLSKKGIDPGKDVKLVELKARKEIILQELNTGKLDAAAIWDPILEELLRTGNFKLITASTYKSQVLVMKSFINAHPRSFNQIMASLIDALEYLSSHKTEVNGWTAGIMNLDKITIDKIASFNPYYNATRKPDRQNLMLSAEDVGLLQDYVDYAFKTGKITQKLQINAYLLKP
jgi:ABC-type nitrate/sulfonate/bicarbonate transport system substrate-binding protein